MGTVLTLTTAVTLRAELCATGHTLVFTNGVFDLLHVGHLDYLEQARRLGDFLLVGVNSDDAARTLKGPNRPWMPAVERARLLAALAPVDGVLIFDALTASEVIRALCPDVYAKGGDYASKPLPETEVVQATGGRIVLLPYLPDHSTSRLIARITGQIRQN